MINIFQPCLGDEELSSVEKVFRSNWIGKGEHVKEFEEQFAQHLSIEQEHFTTTTSCSEAIFLASELFDYNSNDEIVAPGNSFIAIGNSVLAKQANLVLCDVDRHSLNVRAEDIAPKISPRTKAVIITHYGGFSCDMDPIVELCNTHNVLLIEDAACATKSFYKGRACGTIGDMGMWSFGAMKVICTGDGGMVYLKSKDRIPIANEFLYHGFPNKLKSGMDSSSAGKQCWWEYEVCRHGRRAIMNNISGAIGVKQLEKIDSFIARKKEIYEIYQQELSACDWLRLPPDLNEDQISSYYFYWLQLEKRDALARFLLDNGVYSTFRYWPLHKIKLFQQQHVDLPNTEYASQVTLNIPLHQALTDDDVGKVVELIKKFGKLHM